MVLTGVGLIIGSLWLLYVIRAIDEMPDQETLERIGSQRVHDFCNQLRLHRLPDERYKLEVMPHTRVVVLKCLDQTLAVIDYASLDEKPFECEAVFVEAISDHKKREQA